jgi:high-affinity K+ transport system ATPase subunit B
MDKETFLKMSPFALVIAWVMLIIWVAVVSTTMSRSSSSEQRMRVTESVSHDILSAYTLAYIESTHANADSRLDTLIKSVQKRIASMCSTTAQPDLIQRCDKKVGKHLRETLNRLVTLRKHGRLINRSKK